MYEPIKTDISVLDYYDPSAFCRSTKNVDDSVSQIFCIVINIYIQNENIYNYLNKRMYKWSEQPAIITKAVKDVMDYKKTQEQQTSTFTSTNLNVTGTPFFIVPSTPITTNATREPTEKEIAKRVEERLTRSIPIYCNAVFCPSGNPLCTIHEKNVQIIIDVYTAWTDIRILHKTTEIVKKVEKFFIGLTLPQIITLLDMHGNNTMLPDPRIMIPKKIEPQIIKKAILTKKQKFIFYDTEGQFTTPAVSTIPSKPWNVKIININIHIIKLIKIYFFRNISNSLTIYI
jgi:hypothetical protein